MFKITYTLVIILLLSSSFAFGQKGVVEKYRNDLAFLKEQFEKEYPSMHRFNTKERIDKLFDSCRVAVNTSTTDKSFYATINFILSKIRDGHLSCSAPDALMEQLMKVEKQAPFTLYFINDQAYVYCANNILAEGIEIIAINDTSISQIKKKLSNYIVSDGKIEANKHWVLNRSFWFYYNMVYGKQENYLIKYIEIDGQSKSILVDATLDKNRGCNNIVDKEKDDLLTLRYTQNNIAILTIKTFEDDSFSDANLDYPKFLETSFKDIDHRKPLALILDLRGNDGGADVNGSLLYSYLTNEPFRYYKSLQTSKRILTERDHSNLAIQEPSLHNFKGRVYILIDGLSFSVTAEFCSIAKDNNRAIFIGEETGGTFCGNTSGNSTDITLPFSKIGVEIPTTKYVMALADTTNKDRGIMPDFSVQPTMKDVVMDKDVQLNFAIGFAEKNERH